MLATALQAEVVYDGSLPGTTAGNLAPVGSTFTIDQASGFTAGSNLFHSFSSFNLTAGQIADFTGAAGLQNILARVTGGNESSIDGQLKSSVSGANLYFINPAGVIFGPNASVNVTGSFYVSTADHIKMVDGSQFNAAPGVGGLVLTASPPEAFGFVNPSAGDLRFNGSKLTATAGKEFGVVGGDITLENDARLTAANGGVHLVGTATAGEVHLNRMGSGAAASSTVDTLGDVTMQNSSVNVSGSSGGEVYIRGGKIVIERAAGGPASTGIAAGTSGAADGLGVDVEAQGQFDLRGSASVTANNTGGTGRAGDIRIQAGDIQIDEGAFISARNTNSSARQIGDIRLGATGDIRLNGQSAPLAQVFTSSGSQGKGGSIFINAGGALVFGGNSVVQITNSNATAGGSLSLRANGGVSLGTGAQVSISTRNGAVAPVLEVTSGSVITLASGAGIFTRETAAGAGASIAITGAALTLQGSGAATVIQTATTAGAAGSAGIVTLDITGVIDVGDSGSIGSVTRGSGAGGSVSVTSASLNIDGSNQGAFDHDANPGTPDVPIVTGISSSTESALVGAGAAGNVSVTTTGGISLINGGIIKAETVGAGSTGTVTIHGLSLLADRGRSSLTGISALQAASGIGSAGNVDVRITNAITLRNGGFIDTSTFGAGDAGTVFVKSSTLSIDRAGSEFFTGIGSDTDPGGPGLPAGHAGTVTVEAAAITLRAGGNISSSTFGPGDAGNVTVTSTTLDIAGIGSANATVPVPNSGVLAAATATSSGKAGTITINASVTSLTDQGMLAALTNGSGDAGKVTLTGSSLVMGSRAQISSLSTSTGTAGGVDITLSGDLSMTGKSLVSVESALTNAGDVILRLGGSLHMLDSDILTSAGVDGGSVDVTATQFITLDGSGSHINAAAVGNGGNIFLRGARFVLLNDSILTANAIFGNGGQILINSGILLLNNSRITASSQFGADGEVRIDALSNLSSTAKASTEDLLDASDQLQPMCTAKIPGETGSFILVGKGGLPVMPGRFLPAHVMMDLPDE